MTATTIIADIERTLKLYLMSEFNITPAVQYELPNSRLDTRQLSEWVRMNLLFDGADHYLLMGPDAGDRHGGTIAFQAFVRENTGTTRLNVIIDYLRDMFRNARIGIQDGDWIITRTPRPVHVGQTGKVWYQRNLLVPFEHINRGGGAYSGDGPVWTSPVIPPLGDGYEFVGWETPADTGVTPDGSRTQFSTASEFVSGTLFVWYGDIKQEPGVDYSEDAGLQSFTLNFAPEAEAAGSRSRLRWEYMKESS